MERCLYCNKEKEEDEFSQEHVLPRILGGAIEPVNPFSIKNVCKKCNSLSGFFIDEPFAKSWFLNNNRSQCARKFIHLTERTVLPLTYMGEMEDLKQGNLICENWIGVAGEMIYHFHEPYPEEKDVPYMVGVPSHSKNKGIDPGFVFVYIVSDNPEWHPAIFNSFVNHFKKSKLYLGNGPTPPGGRFSEIPNSLNKLHGELTKIQGTEHKIRMRISADQGERFLAKLGLGLGALLLDESFVRSKDADLLRKCMRTSNSSKRQELEIFGSGILSIDFGKGELSEILSWEGGHVLGLVFTKGEIALYSSFYEETASVLKISSNPSHWKSENNSIFYVIIPGLKKAVGPLSMEEIIAHKSSVEYSNPDLSSLEEEMSKFKDLPPIRIKD